MENEEKVQITKISKEFASGFKDMLGEINGTAWLIVDPLSGYLNSIGYENKLGQLPATKKHGQILIITFKDGSQFIPAGADLKPIFNEAENWMWI